MIFRSGAIAALAPLLVGNTYKVQMPTLKCLAMLVFENADVASAVASASYNGDPIPSMLMRLLLRDKTSEMQLAAAKCLAYLYRGGAMEATDTRIVNKVHTDFNFFIRFFVLDVKSNGSVSSLFIIYEVSHEKTCILNFQKQRHRSAVS